MAERKVARPAVPNALDHGGVVQFVGKNDAAWQARRQRTQSRPVLDDIVYVSKDQAETSVLFELIGSCYERRPMLITANRPFGDWGKIFADQAITLAAIAQFDTDRIAS